MHIKFKNRLLCLLPPPPPSGMSSFMAVSLNRRTYLKINGSVFQLGHSQTFKVRINWACVNQQLMFGQLLFNLKNKCLALSYGSHRGVMTQIVRQVDSELNGPGFNTQPRQEKVKKILMFLGGCFGNYKIHL